MKSFKQITEGKKSSEITRWAGEEIPHQVILTQVGKTFRVNNSRNGKLIGVITQINKNNYSVHDLNGDMVASSVSGLTAAMRLYLGVSF